MWNKHTTKHGKEHTTKSSAGAPKLATTTTNPIEEAERDAREPKKKGRSGYGNLLVELVRVPNVDDASEEAIRVYRVAGVARRPRQPVEGAVAGAGMVATTSNWRQRSDSSSISHRPRMSIRASPGACGRAAVPAARSC
jgi:hypothetical protein